MMTICVECKHHIFDRKSFLHPHQCTANPYPRRTDPVTGLQYYHYREGLAGDPVHAESPFKPCEVCNNGACEEFEPIPPSEPGELHPEEDTK